MTSSTRNVYTHRSGTTYIYCAHACVLINTSIFIAGDMQRHTMQSQKLTYSYDHGSRKNVAKLCTIEMISGTMYQRTIHTHTFTIPQLFTCVCGFVDGWWRGDTLYRIASIFISLALALPQACTWLYVRIAVRLNRPHHLRLRLLLTHTQRVSHSHTSATNANNNSRNNNSHSIFIAQQSHQANIINGRRFATLLDFLQLHPNGRADNEEHKNGCLGLWVWLRFNKYFIVYVCITLLAKNRERPRAISSSAHATITLPQQTLWRSSACAGGRHAQIN